MTGSRNETAGQVSSTSKFVFKVHGVGELKSVFVPAVYAISVHRVPAVCLFTYDSCTYRTAASCTAAALLFDWRRKTGRRRDGVDGVSSRVVGDRQKGGSRRVVGTANKEGAGEMVRQSPFHAAQIIYMLALKAKMPSFNKNKKKRSEKIKAEKREKKSLQAVPPAVPEGCVHPMWMPDHEGDVL